MSITYPDHSAADLPVAGSSTPSVASAPYTPVYARSGKARNGRKAVRTWMILAPVGAAVLIGGAAAMMFAGESVEPLTAPVPIESAPLTPPISEPSETDISPSALTAAAPIAPVANSALPPVAIRSAPVRSRASTLAPGVEADPVVEPSETVTPPAGPQPYVTATEEVSAPPATPTPVLTPEMLNGAPID